jgi:glyoxylase I family protein
MLVIQTKRGRLVLERGFRVERIHHTSVLVANVRRSLEFYEGLLGLERDPQRPDMAYAGAWLKVGTQQIHLLELPNPDPLQGRPEHGGRDRHVALLVSNLDELERRLHDAGVPFTRSRSGRAALFCRDPDQNALEFIEAGN